MINNLIAYSFSALLLTLTPGLDTALILRTSISESKKKAFQAALGINTGCFIWGAIVAFGLGALLSASEVAYNLLKWCGAIYLAWLGLQFLLNPRSYFEINSKSVPSTISNWFLKGMLSNVLNPKMGVFYISFLPQFIPIGHSPIIWTFLLVTIHILIGTLWSLTLITTTRHISFLFKKSNIY